MKNYYCKEMRGDGKECGETREEKFYEGRKSTCKYCESKKVYQKEKDRKKEEIEEENSNQEVLNIISENIEKKFKVYDKAYNFVKEKMDSMNDEIEALQKVNKLLHEELKKKNKELESVNNQIDHLASKMDKFNFKILSLDRRTGYCEYKNHIRDDNPFESGFEKFKDIKNPNY